MKKQWLTFCARFSSALVAHPIFYRRQHTTHKKKQNKTKTHKNERESGTTISDQERSRNVQSTSQSYGVISRSSRYRKTQCCNVIIQPNIRYYICIMILFMIIIIIISLIFRSIPHKLQSSKKHSTQYTLHQCNFVRSSFFVRQYGNIIEQDVDVKDDVICRQLLLLSQYSHIYLHISLL